MQVVMRMWWREGSKASGAAAERCHIARDTDGVHRPDGLMGKVFKESEMAGIYGGHVEDRAMEASLHRHLGGMVDLDEVVKRSVNELMVSAMSPVYATALAEQWECLLSALPGIIEATADAAYEAEHYYRSDEKDCRYAALGKMMVNLLRAELRRVAEHETQCEMDCSHA